MSKDQNPIRIAAVGDIAFEGNHAEKPNAEVFSEVSRWLKQVDVSIGNLENPLIDKGKPILGKCTLHGSTEWAGVLKASGFHILSLANNHMMDYGPEGLKSTIFHLKNLGLAYVGAGMTSQEALASYAIEVKGKKIGILARSCVEVASHCYATDTQPGVALFDATETAAAARGLKQDVDYVILVIHWGLEEYSYPTPMQRIWARELIAAGVDCIIGHHPHVLQGFEIINRRLVLYSLGNFFFEDFEWKFRRSSDEQAVTLNVSLSEENRRGVLALIEIGKDQLVIARMVPTYVKDSIIEVKNDSKTDVKRLHIISKRLNLPFYRIFWKIYSIYKEFNLRIAKQIPLAKILKKFYKIRPHHFKTFFSTLRKSAKIITGKTTNPYD